MAVVEIDKNKYKLTFEVNAERFEEGLKHSYQKNKDKFYVQGFRKGKTPRKLIEINYGKEVFYEDAISFVLQDAYTAALEESGLDVVSRPDIDVEDCSAERGVVFTAEVYVKPAAVVEDYKGLTYKKMDMEPTEDEISKRIEQDREKNARMVSVERAVETGDIVTIDFTGYIDGVPFEGGEGKDHELTIGSKSFIDTFEEQLVGASVGDQLSVNVTFPEEYHEASCAGKPAEFQVTINDVRKKELPELDDDFAADVSEFDTFEEYKKDIVEKLSEDKKKRAERSREDELMDYLIDKTEVDVPDVMYEQKSAQLAEDYKRNIYMQGIDPDMYMKYLNMTDESLMKMNRPSAEKLVKGVLALEAVAKAENIQVTDDEVEEEITKMAETYKMDREVIVKNFVGKELSNLKDDIVIRKAIQFIIDNAKEEEE